MSDIVSGVLKLTFGFLVNKIRNEIATRLKNGDVTDEECRRLIVSELDDIKSKLDSLTRKDLLSSLCFLQEGVNRLDQSLLQLDSNYNAAESTEQATLLETASSTGTVSIINYPFNDAVALINAIASLKLRSNDRFKSAVESFKLARENATKAFCNEALSIEDRVQASQIRVMARILENLEDPDASLSDCLQYLKQLHDIGSIQEIFSVLIDGGIKLRFNKTKRRNNASSVQIMNQILFEFARRFVKSPMLTWIFHWPMILLGEKSYHPVFGEDHHVGKLKESGLQVVPASLCPDFTFGENIYTGNAVVDSKGQIVALTQVQGTLKIFKRSGESRTLCEVPREEHASEYSVEAMDIDAEDNIHVVVAFRESDDQPWSFKLFIFDENGSGTLESMLPFHQSFSERVRMAINKDGKIAILSVEKKILYIGNVRVEFQVDKSFRLNELSNKSYMPHVNIRFSDFIETNVIAADNDTVYIYTENGQLQRKIKVPEELGSIYSFAINHVTKRILIKTYHSSGRRLLDFSEIAEQICSFCLRSSECIKYAQLSSHPNGPVALVCKTGAVLLQL